VPIRARSFSYAVSVGRDGAATSDKGGSSVPPEEAWSPEHLVLAGLARCTLTSLRFHADREGIEVTGTADASGEVAVRDTDGRYAFIRIKVELDVTLEPKPGTARELIAKAERDCFVGASLTAKPRYRWKVNGEAL
jgi:organic hydroperoxide reductase OsmC/OhrA